MALPKTLFTLIADEHEPAHLDAPIAVAAAYDAHLSVAMIGMSPAPPVDVYTAAPLDWWSRERAEGTARLRDTAERVKAHLDAAGVAYDVALHYVDPGTVSGVAANHARYCDMVVAMAPDLRDGMVWRRAAPALLFESARPVLLATGDRPVAADAETVVVAWNSSREAARAVYSSLDLLKRASMVHITMVEPVAREFLQGEEPGNEIGTYLARHGIRVTVDRLPEEGRGVAGAILRHAADLDADLIVAGAYGHSRLREFVFGGATFELMENADRTILFAH